MVNEEIVPTGSPALMRAINASRIVHDLRTTGPMSRAGLVRSTGLSKPTVTNVVSYLETAGYIEQVDVDRTTESGVGARAPFFRYRASRGQVLGIDIGADKILLVLADLSGSALGTVRLNTREIEPLTRARILEEIARGASELLATNKSSTDTLLAVVAATPGVVSPDGVVTMAPQLPGWDGSNLLLALEDIFPCAVSVEREVGLSLRAERWRGAAQGVDDALFIHLGVGVAAGLLVDGHLYRGAHGAAGEIGMMPVPGTVASSPVGFGPFESATGGNALKRRGQELARTEPGAFLRALAGGTVEAVDAVTVFAAVRQGDPASTELVGEIVSTLANGIGALVCALNPHTIILGGGLSRAADVYLDDLEDRVRAIVPFPPRWVVSTLGDEAVVLGAVYQATELVEGDLFAAAESKRRPA